MRPYKVTRIVEGGKYHSAPSVGVSFDADRDHPTLSPGNHRVVGWTMENTGRVRVQMLANQRERYSVSLGQWREDYIAAVTEPEPEPEVETPVGDRPDYPHVRSMFGDETHYVPRIGSKLRIYDRQSVPMGSYRISAIKHGAAATVGVVLERDNDSIANRRYTVSLRVFGQLWDAWQPTVDEKSPLDEPEPEAPTGPKVDPVTISALVERAHNCSIDHGWWRDELHPAMADDAPRGTVDPEKLTAKLVCEKLSLIASEVFEAYEDVRKDDGRPALCFEPPNGGDRVTPIGSEELEWLLEKQYKPCGLASELADICIRVFDLCGAMDIDLEQAIQIKMDYNDRRPFRHGNKAI